MKNFAIVTLVGVLAASQAGCGSSDEGNGGGSGGAGSAPDFAALETKLTQPSGTFSAGQETAVQDGFATQAEAAQNNPFGGGSGSSSSSSFGVSPQTVQPLDGATSCDALKSGGKGSCACPGGGTLTFDIPAAVTGKPGQDPSGKIDQTVSIVAAACAMAADQTFNGSIYWKIKSPPPLQIFSVHLKITGKKTASYDVDYINQNGVVTFAVEVADGRVLVSAKGNWNKNTKTGTLVITDKNETWTCELNNGKGQCKSSNGTVREIGK